MPNQRGDDSRWSTGKLRKLETPRIKNQNHKLKVESYEFEVENTKLKVQLKVES
jgi:hypothetical protein